MIQVRVIDRTIAGRKHASYTLILQPYISLSPPLKPFHPHLADEAALSARSGKSPSEVHDELVGPLRSAGPVAKGQLLQGTVRRLQGGRDLGKWVPRPPLALYTKSIKRRLAPVRSPEPVHQPQRKKEDEVDRPKKTARVSTSAFMLRNSSFLFIHESSRNCVLFSLSRSLRNRAI